MSRASLPFSPDLRHLRACLHVARTGSASRAAGEMHLTQSRVSQLLKELEEGLGVALFTRISKRLTPTPAGRKFIDGAASFVERLDIALREAADASDEERSHLRLGVVPACNGHFMPEILGRLHARYPGYTVSVQEGSANDLEREIEAGRLDAGLGFLPHSSPSLRYTSLLKERFSLIVGRKHALSRRAPVRSKDLQGVELALLPARYYMRQLIEQFLTRNRIRSRIVVEIDSLPALIRTVHETGMATLLPPFVMAPNESNTLVAIPLEGRQLSVEVGIMHPPSVGRNSAVDRFMVLAKQVVRPRASR
jgi:LysR family transcriptional regulator, cyn operon transcriptional activator